MTKKILLTSVFTILFAGALFMVYGIIEKQVAKKEIQARIQKIPVNVVFFRSDSSRFVMPTGKRVILVLFNSTCEHCQYELRQIKQHITDFNEVELVLASSEPIATISQVAEQFGLEDDNHVNFVKINSEDVYGNFGTVRFPTVLVYGADGKLVKEFKGKTKIEALLEYAHR